MTEQQAAMLIQQQYDAAMYSQASFQAQQWGNSHLHAIFLALCLTVGLLILFGVGLMMTTAPKH